ncbi:MAG: hypothetical protein K2X08_06645, partial [Chlamydiales bacterium]|nr:hypothetical protein [Chlamydiales bacterium]
KENIHRLDFIVFFDSFTEGVQNLCHLIGIDLEEESLLHLNTTNPEAISPELMKKVIQLNELDIALYEYAKNNYSPKPTTYQFHSPFYSDLMRMKKNIDFTFHMPHKGTNWCYREKVNAFSLDQPIYRYVMDKPAEIFFNLEKNEDYILNFTAKVIAEEIQPRVKINEVEIQIEKIDEQSFATYQGHIPSNLITEDLTKCTFFSSKAYQYHLIYPESGDNRKLSFAVETIKIIGNTRLLD